MILTKTLSLANRDPLTDLEALERANEWTDALIDVVPESMLEQCFTNARHEHSGPFPINYHEILDAYKRLTASTPPAYKAYEGQTAVNTAPNGFCDRCRNSGYEEVFDVLGHSLGVKGANSCDHRPVLPTEGLALEIERRHQSAARYATVLPEGIREKLFPSEINVVPINQEQNA